MPKTLYAMYEPRQDRFGRMEAGAWRKDVIRCGSWRLKDGRKLDVTPDRMDHWVSQFQAMRAAGIRVSQPVDHSRDSKDNTGWVEDVWREGDTLYAKMRFEDEGFEGKVGRAIAEVSVAVDPTYTDGTGKVWEDVISHVAPCTEPVVIGQGPFERLAASQAEARIVLTRKKETGMSLIEKVRSLLGKKAEEGTEEELSAELAEKLQQHTETLRRAKRERDNALEASRKKDEEIVRLKAGKEKEPPKETEREAQLRRQVERLEAANAAKDVDAEVAKGKLSPKAKDAAVALLSQGERLELRRGEAETNAAALFREVLGTLPEGASLDMKERAKRTVELRNPNGQGEGLSEKENAERGRKAALERQGRKE